MKRILLIALLWPLAAGAAEWRYAGGMGGGSDSGPAQSGSQSARATPAPADAPGNNTTMQAVRASHGEPDRVLDAVGDPPITRWQYPGFVVYFEHDRVITSVGGGFQ